MLWFEHQIEDRLHADEAGVNTALAGLAEALTGKGGANSTGRVVEDAISDLLKHFGMRPQDSRVSNGSVVSVLTSQLESRGVMYRTVKLEPGWQHEAAGVLLATRTDGTPVTLVPHGLDGYAWRNHATGKMVKITGNGMDNLQTQALLFYRPLPAQALSMRQVLTFLVQEIGAADMVNISLAALCVALLGLIMPALGSYMLGYLAFIDWPEPVYAIALVLVNSAIASALLTSVKTALAARIGSHASASLVAALMMRTLTMPTSFFRKYAPGNLAMRIASAGEAANALQSAVLGFGLTALFSLMYVVQIAMVAPQLLLASFAAVTVQLTVMALTLRATVHTLSELLEYRARRSGWEYELLGGMQKIRLSGAERRAYTMWAELYRREVALTYRGPVLTRYAAVFQSAASLVGIAITYIAALATGIDLQSYMAFSLAYGALSGAFAQLTGVLQEAAGSWPLLKLAQPLLEQAPESPATHAQALDLAGNIELDHVSFSYSAHEPAVLNNLSLAIKPGEYVAIVGPSGSGKSTLMRLLLGFETPQKGAVYFDGHDLRMLDGRSLRRSMGAVLQDGKLFQGSIFANIAVATPNLTLQGAWHAAELAGIAANIQAMPMGMNTIVGEGSGGISGGQRQRILIARAIASAPKILLLDEATSALDNQAQKAVAEALASLKCTRVVIAHRLSTVRHCDRIVVLEGGSVAEQGTYEELMQLKGSFYKLASRQQA